jgi:uncharacterized cupredoxin-like copper-binding protein
LALGALLAVIAISAGASPDPQQARVATDTTLTVRAVGSVLEFVPPNISARQGTRVRIRFINDGSLPHNLVVIRDDDDVDGLATAAYAADQTGYVPVADSAKLVGYTTLASPGQAVEVTFIMPPPGVYPFLCLFPGHANSMIGSLRSLR